MGDKKKQTDIQCVPSAREEIICILEHLQKATGENSEDIIYDALRWYRWIRKALKDGYHIRLAYGSKCKPHWSMPIEFYTPPPKKE